ncbi:MAG: hypothetical protein WBA89_16515 [Microcoleus sp.]|uniref:hypothetical protein n=1 Tax=Microcoleus sp. TaxID=44472 RepID=UPI003C747E3B
MCDRTSGFDNASDRICDRELYLRELLKKSAVTVPNFAIYQKKVGVKMNEMSEKPIYRILNVVSVLALGYYAATSIGYIFESEAHIYSYDSQSYSHESTQQLEANRSGK